MTLRSTGSCFLIFLTIAASSVQLDAAVTVTAKHAVARKKSRKSSRRALRLHQAFVASKNLRSMAQQLLRERTPDGYRGVEAYARLHGSEDAGSLAWFVVAYAHMLDHNPAESLEPLRRASARASDLADYLTYYQATALQQTGDSAHAEVMLRDFEKKFPGFVLLREVHLTRARALLALERPAEALTLLQTDRLPTRADVELTLGRAFAAAGQPAKAVAAFRGIYYGQPLASEADDAEKELAALAGQATPASLAERRSRAELLVKGKRYTEAITEYRALLGDSAAGDRPALEVSMGAALRLGGRAREATQTLQPLSDVTGDAAAQRLYNLGEIARAADDDATFQNYLTQLRAIGPTSPWLEQALFSSANKYLVNKDFAKAEAHYRELAQRFPTGSHGSYAHWKSAWLLWRMGQGEEARREFEQQIMLFPDGAETPSALYWRGRAAEEDHEPGRARAYYEKLNQIYHSYYYGQLARKRMETLTAPATADPALASLRVPVARTFTSPGEPPADSLRVQKASLLANGAMLDLALKELHAAALEEGDNWEVGEMARLCQDAGRYDRALDLVKHEVPRYFSVELTDLPPPYWQALFPRPFWTDLKTYSIENGLDPYLVAALVRQESAFNPSAISHANAIGLMQLLPSTGRLVAKDLKIRHFNPAMLTVPGTNLRMGTKYFKGMVDQFGAVEYALAAYNAGSDRVIDWQGSAKYRDIEEFVESIPFTETREYVQAIQRNANVYRQLYGAL